MSEAEKSEKIELNEVMLAMDVVDTLRHQQSLVDRELGTDDHDQALIAKVRKIYADQGLEVSDGVIVSGVKALREERFTYTPPKKELSVDAGASVRPPRPLGQKRCSAACGASGALSGLPVRRCRAAKTKPAESCP
jgi:hypothetical protein